MRVKLCARCPYTPCDLAHHYDPEAALYACAKCDEEQYLCVTRWRRKCSTEIETASAAKPSAALFAKESLASSAIIAREPRSAPRDASISSGHGATTTRDGCGDFAPPDEFGGGSSPRLSSRTAPVDRETLC